MKRVLFVCTANSARSQMAEALLRHHGGSEFEACSAGTSPARVNPEALAALAAINVDTSGLASKSVDSLRGQSFDYVITLCSTARRECSSWPGSGVVLHWDFADPVTNPDPKAFATTLKALDKRIRLFVEVNNTTTDTPSPGLSAVSFYKALADELRLKSLLLLQQRELCVCDLVTVLDEPQPKVSRHLAQLRQAGVVLDRRAGQWVYYRLHPLMAQWMKDVIRMTGEHSRDFLEDARKRLDSQGGC